MIQRLRHTDLEIAQCIRDVFQKSYTLEAELLGVKDFPPLQRKLNGFLNSDNVFYGFFMDEKLTAVIETLAENEHLHIQSLAVLPEHFKMGIASGLLSFVFNAYPANLLTVETGVKNIPATKLYQKFGFIETKQWETDHGVRKVRFEKKR